MIRLVAADLDGTLVGPDGTVSGRTRAVLARCERRGIAVVVVTARRWLVARPLLADLGLRGLAIVAGGGAVRELATGRVVIGSVMRPDAVAGAVDAIATSCLQPMVAVDLGEHYLAGDPRRDGAAAARQFSRGTVERASPAALRRAPATRVLAMGPSARIAAAARRCTGLPCHLLVQDCIHRVDAAGERTLELHAAAASKGTALAAVARLLGVPSAAMLAIGDSPSDLPMLRAAGIGVVMGQAEAGMRRPGLLIAPPAADDGAACAIEQLALKRRARRNPSRPRRLGRT